MSEAAFSGHMIVCGGDALTHRLALDLIHLYRERLTLIIPSLDQGHGPQLAALATEDGAVSVIAGRGPDETTLIAAGVHRATALALTMDDDSAVTQAALLAQGLNPRLRLVLRIFNTTLGQRLENLLNRAPAQTGGSAAVLSASDTATPALVSSAVPGRNQVIPFQGGTFSVVEAAVGEAPGAGIALALLKPRSDHTVGSGDAPLHTLLPSAGQVATADSLETRAVLRLRHDPDQPDPPVSRFPRIPVGALFSRRLRLAALGLAVLIAALSVATWLATGDSLPLSLYLVLMDVSAMGDPAVGAPLARQLLQLLAAFTGMMIMPLVLALVLDNLGALGNSSTLNRPLRTTADHIVLVGLGKVGTRVMERLADMRVPVIVVERNPNAPGLARARARRVPVVIGEISQPAVYRGARIARCQTLMALTSNDSVNLEAVLYARERRPDLRVVLRLFDDAFAGTVYRALRLSYPQAPTRSRSVSYLAAPAFAAAMMGRQVLAAIPVERQMLLVAAVSVRDRVALGEVTVGEAYRPGGWRVVAVQAADGRLSWDPEPHRPLDAEDQVIVVATREGLGLLLQRGVAEPVPAPAPQPDTALPGTPGALPRQGAADGQHGVRFRRGAAAVPPLPHLPRAQPAAPYPPINEEELHADSRRVVARHRQREREHQAHGGRGQADRGHGHQGQGDREQAGQEQGDSAPGA